VAEGLAAIHARGMAHGCFGPERVLLTAAPGVPHGFRARVTDYGLAPPAGGPAPTQARHLAVGSDPVQPRSGPPGRAPTRCSWGSGGDTFRCTHPIWRLCVANRAAAVLRGP
jgi:hypothetical protein